MSVLREGVRAEATAAAAAEMISSHSKTPFPIGLNIASVVRWVSREGRTCFSLTELTCGRETPARESTRYYFSGAILVSGSEEFLYNIIYFLEATTDCDTWQVSVYSSTEKKKKINDFRKICRLTPAILH